MKMKKWTLWMIIVALILSLTACSAPVERDEDEDEDKEVIIQEDADEEEDRPAIFDEPTTEPTEPPTEAPVLPPVVFEEFVAVDTDDFSVTLTGIDPDNTFGYTVKVLLENKSVGTNYVFTMESACVDGVSSSAYMYENIAPGKKANAEISFSDNTLRGLGILFSDLELVFRIFNNDDWMAKAYISEPVHVLPYGEEFVQHYTREPQESDIVLIDTDLVSVIVTGIDPDALLGYTLKTYVMNKSTDTHYNFFIDHASVDGLDTNPFWTADVPAGKVAFEDICFSDETLDELGLAYSDIELAFRIYDPNDFMTPPIFEDTVAIYPNGAENTVAFVREPQPEDLVLVDDDNVTLIVTGYETSDFLGYLVNVFIVNKTDAPMMLNIDSASVNGFMCDPFWAKEVAAGKCAFESISWSESSLAKNGITTVEEIEMLLHIYNSDNYYAPKYVNETFTLVP